RPGGGRRRPPRTRSRPPRPGVGHRTAGRRRGEPAGPGASPASGGWGGTCWVPSAGGRGSGAYFITRDRPGSPAPRRRTSVPACPPGGPDGGEAGPCTKGDKQDAGPTKAAGSAVYFATWDRPGSPTRRVAMSPNGGGPTTGGGVPERRRWGTWLPD